MTHYQTPGNTLGTPYALILSPDSRLARLLETELLYLGIPAHTEETLPAPQGDCCFLVADGDSFGVSDCARLAADCACPLLMFGRETAELPQSAGRSAFLRRPFALTELEQAIRMLLSDRPAEPSFPKILATGLITRPRPASGEAPLKLTLGKGEVTVGSLLVPLTPAEEAILSHLLSRRGQAVPRAELAALLGGGGNSVDVYVCHLRSKIEKPLGRRLIRTVRGVGYCLDGEA